VKGYLAALTFQETAAWLCLSGLFQVQLSIPTTSEKKISKLTGEIVTSCIKKFNSSL
jgi:hypothetical protein